jgi:hypothetical protein
VPCSLAGYYVLVVRRSSQRTKDAQYECQLSHSLAKMCGMQLRRTTPQHPAANGLEERLHCTMKAAIMCHEDEKWTEVSPLVLLSIRTAYKEDLQSSAAEFVYGEPLRVLSEFWYHPPSRSRHPSSYSSSAATWTSCGQPQQHTTHPRPQSSTRTSGTRPTYSCGRTPYAETWSHPTAARTK